MEVRPIKLPAAAETVLGWVAIIITAPIWAPVIGLAWVIDKLDRLLDPPRWHRVFALWPVECDPWPDDGFSGWVWLEPVWRNKNAPGWTPYRREAPQDEAA